ncbi:uncharacterized protein EV420DRAFT_1763158 [Desarmillaria tabescens]|uniref:Uncharacterized protein n=1 Tax=Armillaria tabescens TaxID=1929756 RepID=A0AA39KFK6_ARMTA|nr:uncharacterized protein EV420DRAFT_1763158 [Desarmillaria tabescens]KAK0460267.1 hypothetical protein EV420DRAFT_1763158 [Desarmillaria tabescens]
MEVPAHDLYQDDKTIITGTLDLNLNTMILQALLHGLYTGIIAVTLWTILFGPKQLRSTFLRTIIVMLYIFLTILFGSDWAFRHRAFIEHGNNYYSVFSALVDPCPWWRAYILIGGLSGGISSVLVDVTIIWRCWVLWDRQWRIVSLPILCTMAGTVMKTMQVLSVFRTSTDDVNDVRGFVEKIDWSLSYILMTLATTLTCMLLIVYRVARQASGMSASRKIVKMLIESSAIYSLSLIVYLALVSKNLESVFYADLIAAYIKAIAPTLLVGRISAHANASSRRQQMVTMLENHPPLVGCFREEGTENTHPYDSQNDGHQAVSGSSGKETV